MLMLFREFRVINLLLETNDIEILGNVFPAPGKEETI